MFKCVLDIRTEKPNKSWLKETLEAYPLVCIAGSLQVGENSEGFFNLVVHQRHQVSRRFFSLPTSMVDFSWGWSCLVVVVELLTNS